MAPTEKQQKAQEIYDQLPEEVRKTMIMDNEGNMVRNNRAYRRQKPPADNWYTKATHSIRKKRQNAKKARNN